MKDVFNHCVTAWQLPIYSTSASQSQTGVPKTYTPKKQCTRDRNRAQSYVIDLHYRQTGIQVPLKAEDKRSTGGAQRHCNRRCIKEVTDRIDLFRNRRACRS